PSKATRAPATCYCATPRSTPLSVIEATRHRRTTRRWEWTCFGNASCSPTRPRPSRSRRSRWCRGSSIASRCPEPMLTREIVAQVRRLEIQTRQAVAETFAGSYQSVFKGTGMAFQELGPYQPGDDVRAIDWNV